MKKNEINKDFLIYSNGIISVVLRHKLEYIELDKGQVPNCIPNVMIYKKVNPEILDIFEIETKKDKEIRGDIYSCLTFIDSIHDKEKIFCGYPKNISVLKASMDEALITLGGGIAEDVITDEIKLFVNRTNIIKTSLKEGSSSVFEAHNIPKEDYEKIEEKCKTLALNCANKRTDFWDSLDNAKFYDRTFIRLIKYYVKEYENNLDDYKNNVDNYEKVLLKIKGDKNDTNV